MKLSAADARKMGLGAVKKPKRPKVPQKVAASVFIAACKAHGLPEPWPEFRWAMPERLWAFDWAWPAPDRKVALEIEGGAWTQGRHTRGKGFIGDMEKYNEAALADWRVLRCTPQDVESGAVFQLLKRAMP